MLIKISDPIFQTVLFSIVFLGLLLASIKKEKTEIFFSKDVTNQLKGFAVLAVIFSHIGYFLSSDPRFLYPYSVLAGVGVNIFLFLSGFGLTLSQIKTPLSILSFYKKRLVKLFIPLWAVISIFLIADFFLLRRTYPLSEIISSFLGFFPRADLFQNLDSPLWYFSIIFFYYLTYPLLFIRRKPLVSSLLVLLFSFLVVKLPLPVNRDVLIIYKLHFLAFPLGMLFGLMIQRIKFNLNQPLRLLILVVAVLTFAYTSINSGVGQGTNLEQSISLITVFSVVLIFALSGLEFRLFSLFGVYSYEIYLLHWPILSRFNPFLGYPPFLMVILNLILFIFIAYALQKVIGMIIKTAALKLKLGN